MGYENGNGIDGVKGVLDDLHDETKAFQQRYDGRIAQLESEVKALTLGAQRPFGGSGGGSDDGYTSPEQKRIVADAVWSLLQGDQAKASSLFNEAMERKGMSSSSDVEGGYVVLPVFSSEMTKIMGEISPIYQLARTVTLDHGDTFDEVVDRDQAEARWVGELDTRSETAAPDMGGFRVVVNELYAQPQASQKLIDVASIHIVAWLQRAVAEKFALKESAAFHSGSGVIEPRGFLTYTTSSASDASRTWGDLQYIASGASGAFPAPSASVNPADCLQDVVSSLKTQYKAGAVWLMNRGTAGLVSKLKDAEGRYVWAASLTSGQPSLLLGYPVYESEDMPDVAADSLSIAFGNFQKAYTIVRRLGVRFLVDPFTDKPNVRLYAYARVGGGVNNSEAIKLLKFAAS